MSSVRVTGKTRLDGSVRVQGCKNSVLPIIAASLLNGGLNIIHNCPLLSDVRASVEILKQLGCRAVIEGDTLITDSSGMNCDRVKPELMGALRSSVVFMGAMLSRCSTAGISMPGGCDIGARPIDIHLTAFERMGVDVQCSDKEVFCRIDKLKGEDIYLPFPSVGATENIMLLACMGKGVTRIYNAAREPEIEDLQNFLNSMGAMIYGGGTGVITIYAVKKLHDSEYTVMPDRIETATFACAAAAAGGSVRIEGTVPGHIDAVLSVLEKSGVSVVRYTDAIHVVSTSRAICPKFVSTRPYPGFPTDVQSLIMSVMSCSCGDGVIEENIFENRFGHAFELEKMGADISVSGKRAIVCGRFLHGAVTRACDLRSGAALAVAALAAEGETVIEMAEYIDRGYSGFTEKFLNLGANIKRDEGD